MLLLSWGTCAHAVKGNSGSTLESLLQAENAQQTCGMSFFHMSDYARTQVEEFGLKKLDPSKFAFNMPKHLSYAQVTRSEQ